MKKFVDVLLNDTIEIDANFGYQIASNEHILDNWAWLWSPLANEDGTGILTDDVVNKDALMMFPNTSSLLKLLLFDYLEVSVSGDFACLIRPFIFGITKATQFVDRMEDHGYPTHNVTYTSLVQGICMLGNLNHTLQFIDQLVHTGLVPHVITYSIRLKAVFSVSCSPLGTKIIVGYNNSSPIEGKKSGTSGIGKKVKVFTQPHYLYDFDQWMSNALSVAKFKGFKFVSGGGQYYSKDALQFLITIGNGGPTPEGTITIFFEHTKTTKEYFIIEGLPKVDISTLGIYNFLSPDGQCDDLFYSASDYVLLMKAFFDLRSIQKLSTSTQFRFCYDALHGVVGAYANYIIVEALGAKESSLLNSLNSSMDLNIISFDALYGHKPPNIDRSTRTFLGSSATCDKIFSLPHRLLDSHLEDKVNLKDGVML